MQFQHKRALERQLAKDGGLGWNKAKTAISIMARALERWGYQDPQETEVITQAFVDLDKTDCSEAD